MAVPDESQQGAPDGRRTAMQTRALGVLVALVAVAGVVALVLTLSSSKSNGSGEAAGQPSGSQVGDRTSASSSPAPSSSAPISSAPISSAPATTSAPTTVTPTIATPTTAAPATGKPAAPAPRKSSGSATAATKVVKYTVKKGDNLTVIASWFNQRGYGLVYDWNKSVIGRNPNLIHPGQTIIVSLTGTTMNVTTKTT